MMYMKQFSLREIMVSKKIKTDIFIKKKNICILYII